MQAQLFTKPTKPLHPEEAEPARLVWNTFNWEKADEYKYAEGLSLPKLRWEFLRREECYRNFYAKCSPNEHGGYALDVLLSPSKRADELGEDFHFNDEMFRGKPLQLKPPELKKLIAIPYAEQDLFLNQWYGKQIRDLLDEGFAIFAFDLRRGIPELRNNIEIALASLRTKEKAENPDSLFMERLNIPRTRIDLLRTIDADNEGIEPWEIGKTIYKVKDMEEAHTIGKERIDSARQYRLKL